MKIKILKSKDSLYWYSKYLNHIFEVEKEWDNYLWVREPNEFRCLNFVLKEDCKEVKE